MSAWTPFIDMLYLLFCFDFFCSRSRMEYEEKVKKQAKEMAPNGLG